MSVSFLGNTATTGLRNWSAVAMTRVSFAGNRLTIDGASISMDHPIREAFAVDNAVVVLLDPDADLGLQDQYRNLIAVTTNGSVLWRAELPTERRSDVYWRIASKSPLVASSFSSYDCEIDVHTGTINRANFYK